MSDLASSIDEDDNFLDHQYRISRQANDFVPSSYGTLPMPKSEPRLRRKASIKQNADADDIFNFLPGSDPLRIELTRLENEVRGAYGSASSFLLVSVSSSFSFL